MRPLDHQSMAPTLEGMVTLSQDKTTVTIGIAGLYKITAALNWSDTGCGGDGIIICKRICSSTKVFLFGKLWTRNCRDH